MAVQDLAEPVPAAISCRLLGLGIQNTPQGSALIALSARTAEDPQAVTGLLGAEGSLAVVLAARGAPHVVSRSELPLLRAALYPVDDREAAGIDEVSSAMRHVADGSAISRPALSAALNERVSDSLRGWCERCKSRHVYEGLFRKATLQADLEIGAAAGSSTTVFRPTTGAVSAAPDRERARVELARRYIHATGVATPADLAAWLGCHEAAAAVRPVPLGDRALVVPEREHKRRVWRPAGTPGVILVDREIAGTWRHRSHRGRLHVTLYPFHRLDATETKRLTRDAERVAVVRDASEVAVSVESA